jgi:hypothetical protein
MRPSGRGHKGAAGEVTPFAGRSCDQSRRYMATTHAPPSPRLCWSATFAPST